MDIRCPKCGEPWDIDSIHEEVDARESEGYGTTFSRVYAEFRKDGCKALQAAFGPQRDCLDFANPVIGEILDLMGDDVDGAAALLEDIQSLI